MARRPDKRPKDAEQLSLAQGARPDGADESIAGTIERVTFHKPENGFCVLRVRVAGQKDLVSVVGRAPAIAEGEGIRAEGRYERNSKHGIQFKARELAVAPPSTRDGVEKYLSSGAVKGVGPELAKRLVDAFGEKVFDVVERAPDQLRKIEGVGPKRAHSIAASIRSQQGLRELMLFLHSHGIGAARAVRIHRRYGTSAISAIREDPYRLAREIRGIGFATADQLARKLGVEATARIRLRAGLHHALGEASVSGHCALPEELVLAEAIQLLGCDERELRTVLESEVASDSLIRDTLAGASAIFIPRLHRAQREAAARLRALATTDTPWPTIDAATAIPWAEKQLKIELAPSQREAVATLLATKVGVLTGGPGVGKTTLVQTFLSILSAKKVRVELAAPTGRAAKRLAEATGLEARTLHRLLEVDPSRRESGGFKRGVDAPLDCDLVVVDEASMIDIHLFAALLRAIPPHAGLLLVGDADQLPSVGPGRVLADVIESGAVTSVELTEIFRQAAESEIIRAAHRINAGEMPEAFSRNADDSSDFFFIEANDPVRAAEVVLTVVRDRIPERFGLDALRDVQVLVPMHRGAVGTQQLNASLQSALNPNSRSDQKLEFAGIAFAAGDRVIQTENDYDRDVFNGDLGIVEALDVTEGTLRVRFDGHGETVKYERGDLDTLALAYAITVHKSQGSEYPAVVVVLSTQHYPMLGRRLVYTAVTRGKQLVVVVGQRRALDIALERGQETSRYSKLREWLAADT